jgi:hypothetical protein
MPGIRGVVTANRRPVAGASVVVHAVADPRWFQEFNDFIVTLRPGTLAEAKTNPDGTFALYPARADRVLVRVMAEGFAPAESKPFDYEPKEGVEGVSIAVGPGGTIEGRVVDPTGGDPAGTIVGISRGDTYGRTIRVGSDGKYRFERLTPGPWEVVIREEEILPGRNSSSGGGPAKPIPFNCRVVEGETTVFDLTLPGAPAVIRGRILIDGEAPGAWKAGLYRPGSSLTSVAETDVGADGSFTLRAEEGDWRLLVTSPGGTHVSTVVVAELRLAGEVAWECSYRTGPLDYERPKEVPASSKLYHRFETDDGVLVLTPLTDEGGSARVPAGAGEVVRFSLAVWSKPRLWPRVAKVRVDRKR